MKSPRQHVIVVGGGTAGWMAAAFLQHYLNRGQPGAVAVTVIEPEDIPPIGVGEATVPTLPKFLRALDIDEHEFMRATGATFKQAVRFERWGDPDDPADSFLHPFDYGPTEVLPAYLASLLPGRDAGSAPGAYAADVTLQTRACEQGLAPAKAGRAPYESLLGYAYHFDALRFAAFLRKRCLERGVTRHARRVEQVQAVDGRIQALVLDSGQRVSGDLYVDATGFRGLVIGETDAGWHDWSSELLCDHAWAVPRTGGADPDLVCTLARAREAGWTWRTPLHDRDGTGYVFSGRHCSPDEALAAFERAFAGETALAEPRLIRFRPGRRERFWSGNCVAVGLSAGFIEPLESTSIFLIETGLKRLVENWAGVGASAPGHFADNYNRLLGEVYDEVKDFVLMHYLLARRRDTAFWRDAASVPVPPRLRRLFDLWQGKVPQDNDLCITEPFFRYQNWLYVIEGLRPGFLRRVCSLSGMRPEDFARYRRDLHGRAQSLDKVLPPHRALLAAIHGAA